MFFLPKSRNSDPRPQALSRISRALWEKCFYGSGRYPRDFRISHALFLSMLLAHPMPFSLAHKTWLRPTPSPEGKKERINGNVLLEIDPFKRFSWVLIVYTSDFIVMTSYICFFCFLILLTTGIQRKCPWYLPLRKISQSPGARP